MKIYAPCQLVRWDNIDSPIYQLHWSIIVTWYNLWLSLYTKIRYVNLRYTFELYLHLLLSIKLIYWCGPSSIMTVHLILLDVALCTSDKYCKSYMMYNYLMLNFWILYWRNKLLYHEYIAIIDILAQSLLDVTITNTVETRMINVIHITGVIIYNSLHWFR